jgi:hypothetical protein
VTRLGVATALALLLATTTAGCGGDDDATDAGAPPPDALPRDWLEVGTGYDRFVAYTEPATGELVAGPQGGFHIWTSLRARNPATTMSPLVEVTYERVRDGVVETRDGHVAFAEQRMHVVREVAPPPGFDGGSGP